MWKIERLLIYKLKVRGILKILSFSVSNGPPKLTEYVPSIYGDDGRNGIVIFDQRSNNNEIDKNQNEGYIHVIFQQFSCY